MTTDNNKHVAVVKQAIPILKIDIVINIELANEVAVKNQLKTCTFLSVNNFFILQAN